MDENHKKFIRDTKQIYKKEIFDLRKEREEDLYSLCVKLGGHDFWPQQKILRECVDSSLNRFVEIRECSCCGFREEREIEEEIKQIKDPYAPLKQISEESRKEIYEFAMKRSDEILRGKKEEIKPTPMPEWLEKQFDIAEKSVSQWSENKQKYFANINVEEDNVANILEYEQEKQKEEITKSLRKMGLMKIKAKSDETEEARDYWEFLEENSKVVDEWPEWKKGK